jgi:hypothetical protein
MLERNLVGLKVDHLDRVSITHWSKEGEPWLIVNINGDMGSKFLERWINLGFRQRGQRYLKTDKSERLREIPGELKKEMPSKVQKRSQNLQRNLRTPWISRSFRA